MKPGGGKQKGAEFERTVCKRLSKWVSGGERDDLFWRSAMSGGRATIDSQGTRAAQAGDISSIHEDSNILIDLFYIECKFYKDLQIAKFFFGSGGALFDFWCNTVEEASKYSKSPILIAKQNRYPVLLCYEISSFPITIVPCRKIVCGDLGVVGFDDFLEEVSFDEVQANIKIRGRRF